MKGVKFVWIPKAEVLIDKLGILVVVKEADFDKILKDLGLTEVKPILPEIRRKTIFTGTITITV